MSGTAEAHRPLLDIRGLSVRYRGTDGAVAAVRAVNLSVAAGETVAIVGESGSGKTTTAHAVVGLLTANAQVTTGEIDFDGHDLRKLRGKQLRAIRGRRIGLIPQDPTVSLNPVKRIGEQVAEVLIVHDLADRKTAAVGAVDALRAAGLPDPAAIARRYPHELSGGMRQRVLIAIAVAAEPDLIIADEPTSALDVTMQHRILDHIELLTRQRGTGVLLITHDLGVAADRADRIVVMSGGQVVEQGPPEQILRSPQQDYTRALLAAAPSIGTAPRRSAAGKQPAEAAEPLLSVTGLAKEFPLPRAESGRPRKVRAVDDVGFTIPRGQTYALVGESGSGKSTTARLVLRAIEPDAGRIRLAGEDITEVRGDELRRLRQRFQIVQQNPYASLNPRFSIERVVTDPLRALGLGTRAERRRRVRDAVEAVALPSSVLHRRPAELSGGQRQRVAIARALVVNPELVVCDEPVSALDVSIQAQILDLLIDLQAEFGVSYLFISHDLAVVQQIAHQVGVMRAGRLVEQASSTDIFRNPEHPYTKELLAAIPGQRFRT
ncbi:ABC transporter ATP-binding protein [Saccharopolyspora indica]|uniref:dipeptide ABC transporter ATP-binding protein n=1 Tax=Saccharopolyspora indica TaxID=1229659 RepID=UPI0022EAAC0E|nr:ABC transporter ATP-binding protein [Saccharopolyspora indica]MDA3644133.1 ABC transporter ATP-binding protein [Saccharopolyspora indica]